MPVPIQYDSTLIDLGARFHYSKTVAASPALAAETIIASLTVPGDLYVAKGVFLTGWAAFTVGTAGVSATLRIRQTDTAGTVVVTSGATTVVAASLYAQDVEGIDAAPVLPGQVYALTLQIGSGGAASTVSAVALKAYVV